MKLLKSAFLVLALVLSGEYAWASAGRVLLAVGDTVAVRNGVAVKLQKDSAIESGDVLKTGEDSNLQVRFSDGSLFALRSNTQFEIEQYAFKPGADAAAPPQEEKGFFSLVRGGMRTISGLIGKKDRNAYAVKTLVATAGIRGTHYSLVTCQGDCHNADGSLAKDGTYGGVLQGAIVLTNHSGEQRIEKDQFFHVASIDSPPQRLLAPPSFLRDKLDGQARSNKKDGQSSDTQQAKTDESKDQSSSTSTASSSSSTSSTDSSDSSKSSSSSTTTVVTTENKTSTGTTAVISNSTSTTTVNKGDDTLTTASSAMTVLSVTSTSSGDHTVECDSNSCASPTAATTISRDSSGRYSGVTNTTTGGFVSRNSATVAESHADAGVIEWGRWTGGPISAGGWFNNLSFSSGQGFHYLAGTPTATLPTTGTVSYNLLGATTPTFSTGSGGGLGTGAVTGGSATVNFVNTTLNASLNFAFNNGNYTLATGTVNFGTSAYFTTSSATFTKDSGSTGVCSSNSCSATVGGFFAGTNASHIGIGYDIAATGGGSFYINGVAVYKRQ